MGSLLTQPFRLDLLHVCHPCPSPGRDCLDARFTGDRHLHFPSVGISCRLLPASGPPAHRAASILRPRNARNEMGWVIVQSGNVINKSSGVMSLGHVSQLLTPTPVLIPILPSTHTFTFRETGRMAYCDQVDFCCDISLNGCKLG